ncbi:MAG: response regulator [Bacteriovoracia bacterium]
MSLPGKRPLALIVDDQPDHSAILAAVLKKFGIDSQAVTTAKAFVEKLQELRPTLCFVDLNLDTFGVGFKIIEAVRKAMGAGPILIVVSGVSDQKATAHAMEIGANDFIVKPLDRDVLASKISRYVKTEELLAAQPTLFPVPDGGSPATVHFEMAVQEVEEFGLRLACNHLLTKGLALHLDGALIQEITGRARPALLTITSTWIESSESLRYGATAEFDASDDELMTAVRRWLNAAEAK